MPLPPSQLNPGCDKGVSAEIGRAASGRMAHACNDKDCVRPNQQTFPQQFQRFRLSLCAPRGCGTIVTTLTRADCISHVSPLFGSLLPSPDGDSSCMAGIAINDAESRNRGLSSQLSSDVIVSTECAHVPPPTSPCFWSPSLIFHSPQASSTCSLLQTND
jgi:hypothetical protein